MKSYAIWLEAQAPFPTRVVSPREDIYEVIESNCTYGVILGRQRVNINKLRGGTSNGPDEQRRVQALIAQMTSPRGYWERLIVDEQGNVVEGQHRLQAAKTLGWTTIPILRIADLGRMYGYDNMAKAVQAVMPQHPDAIRQIVGYALEAIKDSDRSPEKALAEYELAPAYQAAFEAALKAAKRR